MLLDYLAQEPYVQAIFMIVIGGGYCFTVARNHMAKENDAKRLENRQKDMLDYQHQAGRFKAVTVKER